jgi:Fe-Mn family superoxide dismutase
MITLRPLDYSFESLEPAIDAKTMEIHWSAHHQAYVNNLNKILEANPNLEIAGQKFVEMTTEQMLLSCSLLPEMIRSGVVNNAGGDFNHRLWWEQLKSPEVDNKPSESLQKKLEERFGSLATFWEEMTKAGLSRFGSGWVWLVIGGNGLLEIVTTANQDNPVMQGKKPLLGIDVWEHAYYLKYQNRRAEYLAAVRQIIDWGVVEKRLT